MTTGDLHIHLHGSVEAGAITVNLNRGNEEVLAAISTLQEQMHMELQEATDAVNAANTLLEKIKVESTETLQKVADLEAVIASMQQAGQTVPQELADAITALTSKVSDVDALVPDAAAPTA